MDKAVELFLNIFFSLVSAVFFGMCLYSWLFLLKGHPLRRKVLGEFAILALATILLLILWHLTRDLREAENMVAFLVIVGIYFLGYLIFHIWFFSSAWAFIAPPGAYIQMIKEKIPYTQEEFYRKVDEVLRKSIEDFSKRRLFYRVSQFLGILMPIGFYLSIFLMIHNLTFQFLMPDVLYAKISDRDEFLALYVSSPKDEELKGEFLILSLPDKRVVERLSVREGDRLKVLGWLNDTIWVEKTEGINLFLLSWRREDGYFRFNKQSFPPERYESFHLLGYPPHLFAVLRGEKIARLREKDRKWEEDAIFTAPKGLKNWEELRQFLWSWDGKPFYVLIRASKSGSSYKIGVASPGEEARWLYSRAEDKQAMLDSSTCFSFGDRFYLLLQEVRQDSGRSSQFFLAEVSPQRVKVRKLISDVYYFGEPFNAVPTKDGFLVLYSNFINKSYIFIVPPKGEWRAIEWRRKGFMMAVALKTQNKVLLFSGGRIFLLDAETGMCEDFASIKELLKERSKNAGI